MFRIDAAVDVSPGNDDCSFLTLTGLEALDFARKYGLPDTSYLMVDDTRMVWLDFPEKYARLYFGRTDREKTALVPLTALMPQTLPHAHAWSCGAGRVDAGAAVRVVATVRVGVSRKQRPARAGRKKGKPAAGSRKDAGVPSPADSPKYSTKDIAGSPVPREAAAGRKQRRPAEVYNSSACERITRHGNLYARPFTNERESHGEEKVGRVHAGTD